MSLSGTSRFTLMLATFAILGTAGSLTWAIATRADMKSDVSSRSSERIAATRPVGRAIRLKDERSNKFASAVRNDRPRAALSVWGDDPATSQERSVATFALASASSSGVQFVGADMPLPVPPASLSVPDRKPAKSAPQQSWTPPQPPVAESQKRLVRDPKSETAAGSASNPTKLASQSYYVEKLVEQGDAGEVKFRYRRRACEPPNMPDVCFMPQENRRGIVVERR
jgi:hypothetical protein